MSVRYRRDSPCSFAVRNAQTNQFSKPDLTSFKANGSALGLNSLKRSTLINSTYPPSSDQDHATLGFSEISVTDQMILKWFLATKENRFL